VKLNIHLKFLYLFIGIIFISIMYSTKAISIDNVSKPPECTESTTGVVTISSGPATDCITQPDQQKITFYQFDFCKAEPTAPTLTSNLIKNGCSTFFKNENGAEVTVEYQNGTAIGSESDYLGVPRGTYTHAIITMDPVFKFKNTVTFASANINDALAGSNRASVGESTCVTKISTPAIAWGMKNISGSHAENYAVGTVNCGDGLTAEEISVGINTIGGTDESGNCLTSGRFVGTNSDVDVFLIDSSGNLVNGTAGGTGCVDNGRGTISRIIGVMPISLNIDRNTSGFKVKYNNSNGVMLAFSSNDSDSSAPFWMIGMDSAYIDMTITAVQNTTSRPKTGDWVN
jgi:hypothetical protein